MSGFQRSPQVLKGAIIGLDIFNPVSSVTIFQYNPEQLSRSLEPQYGGAGGQREALRFAGPPKETITANVVLDATDKMERSDGLTAELGLHPQIAALEMLIFPKSVAVIANSVAMALGSMEVIPPTGPLTLFVYGYKRVVPVKISSMSVTEKAHDTKLNPIRADVNLTMQVLTYNDVSLTHPGYWLYMSHQIVKEVMATISSVQGIGSVLGGDVDII